MQQVFSARLQHLPPISLQILALGSASALPSEIDASLDFLSLPLSLPLPPQPPPALQWCVVGSARWKINSWEGWYLFFIVSEIQVWGSTEKCKGEAKVGMAKSGCGSRWGETQQGKALWAHALVACRPAAHRGPTTSTCSFTGHPAVQAKNCEQIPMTCRGGTG